MGGHREVNFERLVSSNAILISGVGDSSRVGSILSALEEEEVKQVTFDAKHKFIVVATQFPNAEEGCWLLRSTTARLPHRLMLYCLPHATWHRVW